MWTSRRHTVALYRIINVYDDKCDHMDGVIWALAKKMTQWKEDLIFTAEFSWQKLGKYYAEVAPMMVMAHISAHIFDSFQKLRSIAKCDKGIDIIPENETSYTTQLQ